MTHHRLIRLFALTAVLALPATAAAQNAAPGQTTPGQQTQSQQGQPNRPDQNQNNQQAQQTQSIQVTYYSTSRGKDTVVARKTLTVRGQNSQSERQSVLANAPKGATYASVSSRSGTYKITLH